MVKHCSLTDCYSLCVNEPGAAPASPPRASCACSVGHCSLCVVCTCQPYCVGDLSCAQFASVHVR